MYDIYPSNPPIAQAETVSPISPIAALQQRLVSVANIIPEQVSNIMGLSERLDATPGVIDDQITALISERVTGSRDPVEVERLRFDTQVTSDTLFSSPQFGVVSELAARYGITRFAPSQATKDILSELLASMSPKQETQAYGELSHDVSGTFRALKARQFDRAHERIEAAPYPEPSEAAVGELAESITGKFIAEFDRKLHTLEDIAGKAVVSKLGRLMMSGNSIKATYGGGKLKMKYASAQDKQAEISATISQLDELITSFTKPDTIAASIEFMRGSSHIERTLQGMRAEQLDKILADYKDAVSVDTLKDQVSAVLDKIMAEKHQRQQQASSNEGRSRGGQANRQPVETQFSNKAVAIVEAAVSSLRAKGLDDKQIKRQLVKQYHPDVSQDPMAGDILGYFNYRYAK